MTSQLHEAAARAIADADAPYYRDAPAPPLAEYAPLAAAAIDVVRQHIAALDGVSFYEEDGGLIDMGDLGDFIARADVLSALAGA